MNTLKPLPTFGMFRFLTRSTPGGLEHSRGNKRKMSRGKKTSEPHVHSARVRVAGNFSGVLAAQVKGYQQEMLPSRAPRLGGSPGYTSLAVPCFQRHSAQGDSGFLRSRLSLPARTSVPSLPTTSPSGVTSSPSQVNIRERRQSRAMPGAPPR